jgi:hypothetical protein
MVNTHDIPRSLDASGNIRREKTDFDETKLPTVVHTQQTTICSTKVRLSPNRPIGIQPQIARLATESRQDDTHVRR